MSTKPGLTTWPPASSSRAPLAGMWSSTALITPSVTATSACRPGAPVPSMTVPPRITTSAMRCIFPLPAGLVGRRLTPVSGSGDPSGMPPSDTATDAASPTVPDTMPAAVFMGLREVQIEDRPVPAVGPDDVLIEVSHCGICGSDLHFLLEWGGTPGAIEGHEYSGTVVALGSNVTGWQVGERVVGGPSPRCGTCEYCLAHRPSLCVMRGRVGTDEGDWQGAFARYKTIPARQMLRIPDGLASKHAALAEPMAVALHGITRGGGARPATRWLVTGGGPIGFLSVAALRALGVDDIVVSEPHDRRRELCERLGARTVHPDELQTPPMPHDIVDEPFDVALECS